MATRKRAAEKKAASKPETDIVALTRTLKKLEKEMRGIMRDMQLGSQFRTDWEVKFQNLLVASLGKQELMLRSVRAQADAQTSIIAQLTTELHDMRDKWEERHLEALTAIEHRLALRNDALIQDSVLREAAEKIMMVKYSGVIGDRKAEVQDALFRDREAIARHLEQHWIEVPSKYRFEMAKEVRARNEWDTSGPTAERRDNHGSSERN